MRILRRKSISRVLAITLLLIFLQSTFLPLYTFALTTGPHQPEYTSYESPGATDMVNLMTGDFSFNIPILDVPGPEGGFSLPLTYNAGIGLDQEASWVGLGFNINAGSLVRNINGFPDDADGEYQVVAVKDFTGVHGVTFSLFGVGSVGWNNQTGHYGSLSLLGVINAGWTENSSSVGIAGINVGSDGVTFDATQFVVAVMSVASFVAGGFPANGGTGSWSLSQAIKMEGIGQLSAVGVSAIAGFASSSGSGVPSDGYWKYRKAEKKSLFGFGTMTEYRIWLDQTRVEDMYGTLFLGNAPVVQYSNGSSNNAHLFLKNGGVSETLYRFAKTSGTANQGAASDINYDTDGNKQFYEVNNPVVLATDNFSVKMGGIGGSITPYRLEVGSVSMPREMTDNHFRLAPVPYLQTKTNSNSATYKVPFVYEGQSNSYFHHVGGASSVNNPTPYFGISRTITDNPAPILPNYLTYELNDVTLKNERIKSSVASTRKIPQANYVEWLSNDEVRSSMTYPSRYMDFLGGGTGSTVSTSSDRYAFRTQSMVNASTTSKSTSFSNTAIPVNSSFIANLSPGTVVHVSLSIYDDLFDCINGNTSDYKEFRNLTVYSVNTTNYTFRVDDTALAAQNGKIVDIEVNVVPSSIGPNGLGAMNSIGAFCITAADGTTYHFGLPQYDYDDYNYIKNATDPNKNTTIKRPGAFANTWLLTAITGSDFVDRNSNGIVDDGDWGYWVKLNYGVHTSGYNKEDERVTNKVEYDAKEYFRK